MYNRRKSKKERTEKKHKTVVVEGNREAPYDLEKILEELGECNTTSTTKENAKRKAKKERKRNQPNEQDIVGNDTVKQETTHKIQPQIIRIDADIPKNFKEGFGSSFASPISTVEGFEDCTRSSKQGRDTKGKKAKKERKRNQLKDEEIVANLTAKESKESTQELQSQLTRAKEENAMMKGQLDAVRKILENLRPIFEKKNIGKNMEQIKDDSAHSGNQNKYVNAFICTI